MTPTHLVVPIDEDTFELLSEKAQLARRPLEQEAAHRLRAAVDTLPDQGRVVTVHGTTLSTLEDILSGGSLLSQADLLLKVQRLAGVSFLHVRLPFTPGQLDMLAEKAASQGWTVEQLVERTAPRIYEQFFDLLERSR